MTEQYILEMQDITKVYPNGVMANKAVNLALQYGEIHALMGENGAGKSTLMKILFGSEAPTSGRILWDGQLVNFKNPLEAIKQGIGMVHQHFMLDDDLTVTENIILGMEPTKGLAINQSKARQMVQEVADKYHFKVRPDQRVADLNVAQKQKVELLKALIRGAKLLILDEPTAVLTPQETDELFVQLKMLRDHGHTIVFISHKLNEVKAICSRATVMRAGQTVGAYDLKDVELKDLSRMMVGREVISQITKKPAQKKEATPVLRVEDLHVVDDDFNEVVKGVTFNVYPGQIVGVAGVAGNGQRELIDCVTGLQSHYQGNIYLQGQMCPQKNGVKARRLMGMNHIPEDRFKYGVMADASIEENMMANRFDRPEFQNKGLLNQAKMNQLSQQLVKEYQIKTDSEQTPVRMLSGGNMQKVVAAREMSEASACLIADQPTRGIDVGAASFIHEQLVAMRDQGTAVVLVSADINELLTVSDCLMVMFEGQIVAYFADSSTVTEEELGLYMLGLKQMSSSELEEVMR
ncbi:ABC transporter ATP-binding protein [Vaginisenegalia massiliensis]|uniref:ABC transporter ATP-binding protein n=1 Tax=Vaginisenegalia massiliensis TaxID=2058294 RepID=UPI000F52A5B3|nr:ABC transporter ATP-binding protein [Vaginisenegalia massiliensis]